MSVFAIHSDGSLNDIINIFALLPLPQHALPCLRLVLSLKPNKEGNPLTFLCLFRFFFWENHELCLFSIKRSFAPPRAWQIFSFMLNEFPYHMLKSQITLAKVYRDGKLTQWKFVRCSSVTCSTIEFPANLVSVFVHR